ncbi:MAG TPA: DUF4198 domain-containing protein [Chitinophagaceae bacterium]|nr:DUF4198 domain-containing protein [Chitinophagaceae bacterium]
MKKPLLLSFLLLFTALLSGHEFWLHPDKFIYRTGEQVNIQFLVGENYVGEHWKGDRTRIQTLWLYYANVIDNCANQLAGSESDKHLQMAFFEEGTMMFTFNNLNSFIEMDAIKFNEYLKEDGLLDALEYRAMHHEGDSMGRELYQRSAKTLVQVGEKLTDTYKKQTTLPVDIIPDENPYSLRDGERLKVRVLFHKKPLPNAAVKVWHRNNEQTVKHEFRTNQKGELEFPVFTSGRWMVSTVKMTRLQKHPRANWQSYWGSLTWGYVR